MSGVVGSVRMIGVAGVSGWPSPGGYPAAASRARGQLPARRARAPRRSACSGEAISHCETRYRT